MGIEQEYYQEAAAAEAAAAEEAAAAAAAQPEAEPAGIAFDFSWIKTPTGPGSIESYIDHPLNANGSRGVAQVLRGATGFFGALDLAIVDVTIGALEILKERRQNSQDNRQGAGSYE